MAQMTALEAINQGVYGFYLAERARELAAELDALTPPGCTSLDGMALAAWAGRASVTLSLIAEEFAGPLPVSDGPKVCRTCGFSDCPGAQTGDCPRWPARSLASCGHPANEDGECDCSSWPERAPFNG